MPNKFFDHPETLSFNERIDTIFAFESLLRHPNKRPLHEIIEAMKELKTLTALLTFLSTPARRSYG
jgi:hypothetical protein